MARKKSIGFIGLGAMGTAMATRLMDAGWRLIVFDRTQSRTSAFTARGAAAAPTPREVAELSDIIITMVSDDEAVRNVAFGDDGLAAGLGSGKIYMDMTTASAVVAEELHQAAAQVGALALDVRVSGSVPAAETGNLLVLVGGDQKVCEKVVPVLDVLGRKIIYTGGRGSAAVVKLALNILLALEVQALSEAYLLARKAQVKPSVIVDAITSSGMASQVITTKLQSIRSSSFEPQFKLKLMQKDLKLALDEGSRSCTPLPTTAAANEVAISGIANGLGDSDFAALYQALLLLSGIKPEADVAELIKEPAQSI